MKKITILAFGLLGFFASLAQSNGTRLIVDGHNAQAYNLYINDQLVGDRYKQNGVYIVDDIDNRNYRIRLSRFGGGVFNNNRERVFFNDNLRFNNGEELLLWVDIFGNVSITARRFNNGWGNNGNWNGNNNRGNRGGNGRGRKCRDDDDFLGKPLMNATSYNCLRMQVKDASFDATKVDVIRTAALQNGFTTNQVIGLLNEFCFDANKLGAAKLLYRNTADKQNYFQVSQSFTFESSKRELQEFVKSA